MAVNNIIGGKTFGEMPPPSGTESTALLTQIRDLLKNLTKVSELLAVLQSSLSVSQTSQVSLTGVQSQLASVISSLSSQLLILGTLATEATLSTRASESTLATRASEATLLNTNTQLSNANIQLAEINENVTSFQASFEDVKQESGGQQYLRVQQQELGVLEKILDELKNVSLQLSFATDEELI